MDISHWIMSSPNLERERVQILFDNFDGLQVIKRENGLEKKEKVRKIMPKMNVRSKAKAV